jgi:SAM-dependent methyltransferase
MNKVMNEVCTYCDSTETENIIAREMRQGLREEYAYRYCKGCHSLELSNKPPDLSPYYTFYYTKDKPYVEIKGVRKLFWKVRATLYPGILSGLLAKLAYNTVLDWKMRLDLPFDARIIDVGCGNGDILFEFHKHGFTRLSGIDPFPPAVTHRLKLPFTLLQGDIFELPDEPLYDLVMMHHSFEHMDRQEQVLQKAKRLLRKNGKLFIRMPVVNQAFDTYRGHWVQIDAPRHLSIHSTQSFGLLAQKCGLTVTDTFFDSTAFQFLGSEQNKADIDFFHPRSYKRNRENSIFTGEDLIKFNTLAEEFNLKGLGDQAGFILTPK